MNKKNFSFFERDFKRSKRIEYKFSPCNVLNPMIKEFMIIECEHGIELEILPSASISINYIINGSISVKQQDGTKADIPKAVAFGIARKAQHFTFSDRTTLLVVVFKEGCASSIVKKPINKLFERYIDLNELFTKKQICLLGDQLQRQSSYEGMVEMMERFLITEMDSIFADTLIADAIHRIKEKKGLISIKSLAEELNISRDAFEKKFRSKVGTTPKQYANIVRFRNLIHKSDLQESLTKIGLNAGYYDQSHFIKDFKSFTGKPPSEFL